MKWGTLFVLRIVLQKKPKSRFVDFYTFSYYFLVKKLSMITSGRKQNIDLSLVEPKVDHTVI